MCVCVQAYTYAYQAVQTAAEFSKALQLPIKVCMLHGSYIHTYTHPYMHPYIRTYIHTWQIVPGLAVCAAAVEEHGLAQDEVGHLVLAK